MLGLGPSAQQSKVSGRGRMLLRMVILLGFLWDVPLVAVRGEDASEAVLQSSAESGRGSSVGQPDVQRRIEEAPNSLWGDPYGRTVKSDAPAAWWRLDDVLGPATFRTYFQPEIIPGNETTGLTIYSPINISGNPDPSWCVNCSCDGAGILTGCHGDKCECVLSFTNLTNSSCSPCECDSAGILSGENCNHTLCRCKLVRDGFEEVNNVATRSAALRSETQCISCALARGSTGGAKECEDEPSWCRGIYDNTVLTSYGIPSSGVRSATSPLNTHPWFDNPDAHSRTIRGSGLAVTIQGGGGLELPYSRDLHPKGHFSVELWLRVKELTDYEQIILSSGEIRVCGTIQSSACRSEAEGQNHGYEISINDSGEIIVRMAALGAVLHQQKPHLGAMSCGSAAFGRTYIEIKSRKLVTLGQWQMWTLTYDGLTVQLYLGGIRVGSSRLETSQYVPSQVCKQLNLLVGKGRRFAGVRSHLQNTDLDELAIYTKALSQASIMKRIVATEYDSNTVQPHANCTSPPQTHTNPVQSCMAGKIGLKRLASRGNVAQDQSVVVASTAETQELDVGTENHIIQGPEPWPVNSIRAD